MSLKPGNSPVQSHISQMSLKLVAAGFELGVGKVPLQIEQPPSTSTMKAAQGRWRTSSGSSMLVVPWRSALRAQPNILPPIVDAHLLQWR